MANGLKVRHIEGFAVDIDLDLLLSEIYGCLYALAVSLVFKHQLAVRIVVRSILICGSAFFAGVGSAQSVFGIVAYGEESIALLDILIVYPDVLKVFYLKIVIVSYLIISDDHDITVFDNTAFVYLIALVDDTGNLSRQTAVSSDDPLFIYIDETSSAVFYYVFKSAYVIFHDLLIVSDPVIFLGFGAVACDLLAEFSDGCELAFRSRHPDELDHDLLAVEFFVEVEDVGLHILLESPDCGLDSHVGD